MGPESAGSQLREKQLPPKPSLWGALGLQKEKILTDQIKSSRPRLQIPEWEEVILSGAELSTSTSKVKAQQTGHRLYTEKQPELGVLALGKLTVQWES